MTLEVDIYGRNMDITEPIEKYVDKKVSKLDKFISNIDQARVDLAFAKSAPFHIRLLFSHLCPLITGTILGEPYQCTIWTKLCYLCVTYGHNGHYVSHG